MDMQRAIGLEADPQRRTVYRHARRQTLVFADLVMVAAIRQQRDMQFRRYIRGSGQQAKCNTGGIITVLHPDALFEQQVGDGEMPHRHTAFQAEALQLQVAGWLYDPAGPAVGEQRPVLLATAQCRIGLDGEQRATQRRVQRRDQQPVVTTCQ